MADPIDMTEARIHQKAEQERKAMLIARIKGVPAQPWTPEMDADPRNHNINPQSPVSVPLKGA